MTLGAEKHCGSSLTLWLIVDTLLISKLFTPFVPICSQCRRYICYLEEFAKNNTHRFQCLSTNDVIIKKVDVSTTIGGCVEAIRLLVRDTPPHDWQPIHTSLIPKLCCKQSVGVANEKKTGNGKRDSIVPSPRRSTSDRIWGGAPLRLKVIYYNKKTHQLHYL